MLTLDSISLLLSKQNPTTASVTLSQQLRDLVGIGTLGADRLDASNVTEAMTEEKQNVATGWTILEINQTRDAAESASKFLQKEIAAEGNYWEELMKVQSSGWAICRMPNERHTLGVRFGFSEGKYHWAVLMSLSADDLIAAPDFRNHGLAPMRRNDDGTVKIDSARLGVSSERLVVTYSRQGQVLGRSSLPSPPPEDAALVDRVRDARDTLFAKELWHELTREAKSLAAYNVRGDSSVLTYAATDDTTISLQLQPLEDESLSIKTHEPMPYDSMAEMISIAIHILLTYSHRSNELMRVRPLPPQLSRTRGSQPCALLRPVIARLQSIQNIHSCTRHVGQLTQALRKAGLTASFVLYTPQVEVGTPPPGPNQPAASQLLVRNLLQPIDFHLKVSLPDDTILTIRGRTFAVPATTTTYHVLLPEDSPLHKLCPPYKDGYPDVGALVEYLHTATVRLLTEHALSVLITSTSSSNSTWNRSIKGTSLRLVSDDAIGDLELHLFLDETSGDDHVSMPALVLEMLRSGELGTSDEQRWRWQAEGSSEAEGLQTILRGVSNEITTTTS